MSFYKDIDMVLQTVPFHAIIFFAFLGACIASFYNVVILRFQAVMDTENATGVKEWFEEKDIPFPDKLLPYLEKFNIAFPASHCYSCKTPLKWYHNIPVFSYLFLRGKCGFCDSHISLQYPIVETLGAVILASTYVLFIPYGLTVFLLAAVFTMLMFLLICMDIKYFILPDSIVYFCLWLGLGANVFGYKLMAVSLTDAVLGAIVGYLMLWTIATVAKVVLKKEAMGHGDFKLLAALGVFLGIKGAVFTLFFSPFLGIITWIVLKALRKDTGMVPYGPSLIVAGFVYLFFGSQIMKALGLPF